MGTLSYQGATQASNNDVVTKGYVTSLSSLDLAESTVESLIATGLAPYVTQSYVNTQAALNATPAYIDTADAGLLHLNQINAVNGIAGLDAGGRMPTSVAALTSTQRYPAVMSYPSAYNSLAVSATTTEMQLYTINVADPGYTYKLFLSGVLDGVAGTDGVGPIIHVRQGSSTGQLVGVGAGMAEQYVGGVITSFFTAGTFTFTCPAYAATADIAGLSGGGGGGGNFTQGDDGGDTTVIWGSTTLTASGVGNGGGKGTNPQSVAAGNTPAPQTLIYDGVSYVSGTSVAFQQTATTPGVGGGGGHQAGLYGKGGGGGVWATATWAVHPGDLIHGTVGGGGAAATGGLSGSPGAGAPGGVWINIAGTSRVPTGPISVQPTALNSQTAITGSTTLYVMVLSAASSTVAISPANTPVTPGICAYPVPA